MIPLYILLLILFVILLSFNKKIITHIFENPDLKTEFLTDCTKCSKDEFYEISIDNIIKNMKENSTQSNHLTFKTIPSNYLLYCNFKNILNYQVDCL